MTEPRTDPGPDVITATRTRSRLLIALIVLGLLVLVVVVSAVRTRPATIGHDLPHGPVAAGVSASLGEPVPYATPAERATFERGEQMSLRRFTLDDGLGPTFNVTFCAACHERPVPGGSAGLYRNFFLGGIELPDSSFVPLESAGPAGGVVRMYSYEEGITGRPAFDEAANVLAQRNPIPFFGVGLLAEVSDIEILSRADPDDDDGDGISGRPNYDQGFVGRFGRKAQTVSIEGFIRGPLFNHLGITTDPLTEAQKAALPVDSSSGTATSGFGLLFQAAAPSSPLVDFDGAPDPEMTTDELFDLVAYSMLLAAPLLEEPTEQSIRGAAVFDDLGCTACHTPRIQSPRGPLPVYSDLLLHDMGPDLADGIRQGDATGSEFRTQPLWGLVAVGPYLHDGRASTIRDAILLHGGEGEAARDRAAALDGQGWADLEEFLMSLGGRSQYSEGLISAGEGVPALGEEGGPRRILTASEQELFLAGRAVFDRDFGFTDGVGSPGFNGDSCRACHFDPVVGGSGPAGVNAMRHGSIGADGQFIAPDGGTVLPKETSGPWFVPIPDPSNTIFEHRQTPTLLGMGLIDDIPDEVILANADPDDLDGDGISGVVARTADGRVGRFGWKAQVPSLAEFVRDAVGTELGMTLDPVDSLTFGITADEDGVPDPEFTATDAELLLFFLRELGPPPRQGDAADPTVLQGEQLFDSIGCSSCHIPSLDGPDGAVHLYSDLLLHEILPEGSLGIADGNAGMREFRTPPLWGLAFTGPYLHDGSAGTIDAAIRAHAGEATASRTAFTSFTEDERGALLRFLESL